MKKVLYLTNIEAPYRVRFFNELARHCDLTVLFECRRSRTREASWEGSEKSSYRSVYLDGIKVKNENSFSLAILKYILGRYDVIVVGCYNSPVQMFAMLAMRMLRIPYYLNLDGEPFLKGSGIKQKLKRFFIAGARKYLVAGEQSARSLLEVVPGKEVIPYYFSSLDRNEVEANAACAVQSERGDRVLVVGQYLDVKGLDVALRAAEKDPGREYLFVGMGKRTELFAEKYHPERLRNVRIIPFLQKKELEGQYRSCAVLVLPSRQECWGLVVNEAASFGTPIVSTWGSGAAVEFLVGGYPQYLAVPGDEDDLHRAIQQLLRSDDYRAYSDYLLNKTKEYTIDRNVEVHLHAFGIVQ